MPDILFTDQLLDSLIFTDQSDSEYNPDNSPLNAISRLNRNSDVSSITFNPDEDDLDEQEKKLRNKAIDQDIKHRNILVYWVMSVVSVWLIAVVLIIVFCRNLTDTVKVTLLTTTTINILGLPFIILKGLFGDKDNNKEKKSNKKTK